MLLSGALLIDKPEGLTSSQVVSRIKWALTHAGYAPKGFKIGHGGTLDPFATGTLIVFLGEGTKLADTYLHSKKSYDGIITLGVSSNTGDLTGNQFENSPVPELQSHEWQSLADLFVNTDYWQTPPMFSAKKLDGTPLYELAREGKTIERSPILKKITSFSVEKTSHHELSFSVECESGTYVRVLAEDLAKKTLTVAHLKTLRRTSSSDAKLSQSLPLADSIALIEVKTPLLSMKNFRTLDHLATHIPSLEIGAEESEQLWNGDQTGIASLGSRCAQLHPKHAFVIARFYDMPVGLFENLHHPPLYRLQRVFNEAKNSRL